MIDQFCKQHFALNGISAERQVRQRKTLLEFEDFIDVPIEEAGASELRAYMVHLLETRKLAPTTVRKEANMIRPLFRWMYHQGTIDRMRLLEIQDVRNPRGSNGQNLPNPYERKEIMRFWAELDIHRPLTPDYLRRWRRGQSRWNRVWQHAERVQLHAQTALALYGGLRRVEISRVSLDDIDPLNEFIPVEGARKGRGDERPRKVPYTERSRQWIGEWLALRAELGPSHDYPWLTLGRYTNHYLNPLPFSSLAEAFGKIGSGWELHRFRHTCATEWVRVGMPIEQVQQVMGHATIEQTLAYAKIVPVDALRSMSRLESRFDNAIRPPEEQDDAV